MKLFYMVVENKIFGQRIKELRKNKSLTQSQLAALFEAKDTLVSNWEKHVSIPTLADCCVLADFFNVSLDYLAGRSDSPKIHKPRKTPDNSENP